MPEFPIAGEMALIDALTASGIVQSGSQVRRLVTQNGVKVDGEKVSDPFLPLAPGNVIQVGKRRFLKIVEQG
jgi:tyrosyl-tRNA synthetase